MVERTRDGHWFGDKLKGNSTFRTRGGCCLEHSASNTLECGRKAMPTYTCAAFYVFQRPLWVQTNPESVDRREKEGTDGPKYGENHQRPLGWKEGCHWDGCGRWGTYMKGKGY